MSAEEVAARCLAAMRQTMWRVSLLRPSEAPIALRHARLALPRKTWPHPLPAPARGILDEAEKLLAGEWPVFGVKRTGIGAEPDWFTDPLTGVRAPSGKYCFSIPHRDESVVGNIKYVWEPSRHQATTLLATAYWITGEARYAERAAAHLSSWWRDNPFLMGVHWTSGIEIGLRLLSWTWIRALLGEWEGCADLFENNAAFAEQLYWHQKYLACLKSCGSSANNHLIAELAGLAAAAASFPWFAESAKWAAEARSALEREAYRQTNTDGTNREQASDYHLFVLDILMAAGLASDLADVPLPDSYWHLVARMGDALAAMLDARGNPARFGDADDGRCLVVDTHAHAGPMAALGALSEVVGAQSWWPRGRDEKSVLDEIAASIARPHTQSHDRLERLPALLSDAGYAVLRAGKGDDEIWLRCDHGRLGFLSIAAHGHADALSIELRIGGAEILADPGTYCYHGEPEWRRYFKGTRAHNTLAIRGEDQALYGGPFLWLSSPESVLDSLDESSDQLAWEAHHAGYERFDVTHHRRVMLAPRKRLIEIEDWIEANGPESGSLYFHLSPNVGVSLNRCTARLSWKDSSGVDRSAWLDLPEELCWSLHRGETDPPLGWYSARFGEKEPTSVLVGQGLLEPQLRLKTKLSWVPSQPTVVSNVLVEAGLSQ
ncbi:MAG: alginate lyase family protein [Alphaproteobacteria bacterium]